MAKNPARPRSVPPSQPVKRPRGRPPTPEGARPGAEIQRNYRERLKAAGKIVRVIDTWATMTPAEIAALREQLGNALLQLELRDRDVARLDQRNAYLEAEMKRVEAHNLNLMKENIVLKQATAPAARMKLRTK
jgi:hypothetical protein